MAIGDDWEIDTTNKIIKHVSGTTVYTVNALYSYLVDTFDELAFMQYESPMKAVTTYDYQMINGWWLDIGYTNDTDEGHHSQKYLYNGSLSTLGYDAGTYNDGIRKITFAADAGAVASDVGLPVVYTAPPPADSGVLLGFSEDGKTWWVRVDDTGDTFADFSEAVSVTGGTGAGTPNAASTTGEEQFSCIYSIGTIEGVANTNVAGEVYLNQDANPIAEWQLSDGTRLTNWDRGHINVLIQIKEMGTTIGEYPYEGFVRGFLRQGGDLYSWFDVDLNGGGRSPLPLATEGDINQVARPEYYLLYDNENAGFTVGDIVIGQTDYAEAEVLTLTDWGANGALGLIGVSGTFTDNEVLFVDGSNAGVVNGTLGSEWFAYDDNANTVTVGMLIENIANDVKRKVLGKQDDTGSGKFVVGIDTTDTSNIAKYYTPVASGVTFDNATNIIDTTSVGTEAISAFTDIVIQFVTLDLTYEGQTSNWTVGETISGQTSGATGIVIADSDSGATGTVTLANWDGTAFQDNEVLDGTVAGAASANADGTGEIIHRTTKTYEQGLPYDYDVIIDMNFYDLAEANKHSVQDLYEYMKFVTRWDSSHSMPRVIRGVIDGAAYDFGTATSELTAARDSTANDMTLVDTTGDIVIGDYYAFGSDSEFGKLLLNITTAGDGTWVNTWEYWNGAWVALNVSGAAGVGSKRYDNGATDATAKDFRPSGGAGWYTIHWDIPTDWATTTLDSVTAYYVRARVTTGDTEPITTRAKAGQAYVYDLVAAEVGEEYTGAYEGYAAKAASPFGTFAGGSFYGAQGVWIEGMQAADVQSFSLLDSNGTVRDPPNQQAITVINLLTGDKITVMETVSAGGDIQKDTYTCSAEDQGNDTISVTSTITSDTPTSGVIRIVDVSASDREFRMRYDSWSNPTFTFPTEITDDCNSNGGGDGDATTLYNVEVDWTGLDVEEGDLIWNATDGSYAHVDEAYANGTMITTRLKGGTNNDWGNGDTYHLHTLPYAITGSDTLYVPYIDEISTGTSASVTVIFDDNAFIQVDVRRKESQAIEPFSVPGVFDSDGYSTSCIRNDDLIVT